MLLNPGERVIAAEPVTSSILPGIPFSDPGNLYLTNHRVVFEAVPPGHLPRTALNVSLEQITNVVWGAGPKRTIVLRIEYGMGWACTLTTQNAARFGEAILAARASGIVPPPPPPPPPLIGMHQESAKPAVYLHCKHCGTLSPAGASRCSSCGAAL